MRRLLLVAFGTRRKPSALAVPDSRGFRSESALDLLQSHPGVLGSGDESNAGSHIALYNYPSFSGAYAACSAHLFHSSLRLPFLALPFSSFHPFSAEDFTYRGFETCYLLDFIGPDRFAVEISRIFPRIVAFDHRKSTLTRISQLGQLPDNLELRVDPSKSSARAVFDYFNEKYCEMKPESDELSSLLEGKELERVGTVMSYIEDADLRRWELPDAKEFNIGIRDVRAKLNSVTNPYVFEQLLELDASDLIAKGRSYICSRENTASKLVEKPFKIQLGRGLYGECLAIRADENSNLSHEIGLELSRRSAAAGLRPIGAVVFMKTGILKICLRSTDNATDTSEIAKAYGGGGKRSSSSFTIKMDEYNHWTSVNSLRITKRSRHFQSIDTFRSMLY
ncbi:uncharacterized protein [Typha latifolia]|uniref:uncharacterized protein n=1 Tax=Typha latifolia TaxID=4733 RepID=UPI003C2F719B